MRPIDAALKPSSQQNTTTCFPSCAPSAFTHSVLPVPAGPNGFPPIRACSACVSATYTLSISGVRTIKSATPRYSHPYLNDALAIDNVNVPKSTSSSLVFSSSLLLPLLLPLLLLLLTGV